MFEANQIYQGHIILYLPIVTFVCFPVFKNQMRNQVVKLASKSSNENYPPQIKYTYQ